MLCPDWARKMWLGKEDGSAVLVRCPRCRLSLEGLVAYFHEAWHYSPSFPPLHISTNTLFRFTVWFTKYFLSMVNVFWMLMFQHFLLSSAMKVFLRRGLLAPPVRIPWSVLSPNLHFNYFLVTGSVHASWPFSVSEKWANIFLQFQFKSIARTNLIR